MPHDRVEASDSMKRFAEGEFGKAWSELSLLEKRTAERQYPRQNEGENSPPESTADGKAENTEAEAGHGKRGRPPLPDDERLEHRLTVRMTRDQFDRIEKIAEARDVSPSTAARQILASQRVPQRTIHLRQVRAELRDLGADVRALDDGDDGFEGKRESVLRKVYERLADMTATPEG